MTYKIEKVKQLKNHLERHLSIDLSDAVVSANQDYWKDFTFSRFREIVDMHVSAYRGKMSVNRGSCRMKTFWSVDSNGKFQNCGSITRDSDDTPVFKITITE